ncbi:MAG: hypothetical protein ACRDA4_09240 [Filifactoraceae bacterium]
MLNPENLIGKKVESACSILDLYGLEYTIEETVGYKDSEVLNEAYVIRAIQKNQLIALTIGLFKTNI